MGEEALGDVAVEVAAEDRGTEEERQAPQGQDHPAAENGESALPGLEADPHPRADEEGHRERRSPRVPACIPPPVTWNQKRSGPGRGIAPMLVPSTAMPTDPRVPRPIHRFMEPTAVLGAVRFTAAGAPTVLVLSPHPTTSPQSR